MRCLIVTRGMCRSYSTLTENLNIKELKSLFPYETDPDVYIVCNGRRLSDEDFVQDGCVYHVVPRLKGGKGGFGSMLRAIGAQIDKTNNREACRDLSGRRMRDVNNEKQMKEWLSKQAEKEKEREERRRERWERRKAMPNHKFDDPLYDQQRALVSENLEDALQKGLMKSRVTASSTVTSAATSTDGNRKRTGDPAPGPAGKVRKNIEWLGIDVDNLSDLDSDDGQSVEGQGQSEVTAGACARPVDSSNDDSGSNQSASSDVHNKVHNGNETDSKTTESNCQDKYIIPLESNLEDSDEKMDFRIKVEKNYNIASVSEGETCGGEDSDRREAQCDEGMKKESVSTESCDQSCDQSSSVSLSADDASVKKEVMKSDAFTLEDCNSVEEVEALGLERLKGELMARGLKCGGTLTERAQRLYSVKGLSPDQIDPALFAKPSKGKKRK